ncbi:leucine-rich repeat domain-containing protein, partial [Apibacter muscae]
MKRKNYHFLFFLFFVSWSLCWGQTSREYEVTAPGGLESLVSSEKNTITDLTLTGTLNAADFATIRSMAALQNLNLEKANLVDNTLPNSAFYGKKINNLWLPKTLENVEAHAFSSSNIKSLDFSKSPNLSKIGYYAFQNLILTNGNTLDFSHNPKLSNFPLSPDRNEPRSAFCNFKGEVILPNELKVLPNNLFVGFSGKIHLPEELEEIQNYVFASVDGTDNYSIESLDFSKSPNLSKIGYYAFLNLILTN